MNITEANIEIKREGQKLTSVSVQMPIWSKPSECGNLIVQLPLIGIDTIAKDELDADKAIEEAINSFCYAAEKFGQGLENELLALGWKLVDNEGQPVLGYDVDEDTDALISRIIRTGESYANPHINVNAELEHA